MASGGGEDASDTPVLHWGIVSAGRIAKRFIVLLDYLAQYHEEHKVVAVAARNLDDAQSFAKTHNIPSAYEGYEAIAKHEDVEVAYVATITPKHFDVVRLMLEHGKHVLCERPMAMNARQTRQLVELAKQKKLFLMEAIPVRQFPLYLYVKNQANEYVGYGLVQSIEMELGFDLRDDERIMKKSLGGGAILNLGVMAVQLLLWLFGEPPKEIQTTDSKLNEDGVDVEVSATFKFKDNLTATFKLSTLQELHNEARICYANQDIIIHDFYCPQKVTELPAEEATNWSQENRDSDYSVVKKWKFYGTIRAGKDKIFLHEMEECLLRITEGDTESKNMPLSDSVEIARILDELREKVGVSYPEDQL